MSNLEVGQSNVGQLLQKWLPEESFQQHLFFVLFNLDLTDLEKDQPETNLKHWFSPEHIWHYFGK